jgi:hypothetical protein
VLEEKSVGRSAKLSASEESLRSVFTEAQDNMLEHFADQRLATSSSNESTSLGPGRLK